MEKIMRSEKLDFIQINCSIMEREAEERILPLAQERGIAVIINRPFGGGGLFDRVRSKSLPEWSAEFDTPPGQERRLADSIGQGVFQAGFDALKSYFGHR